jgi:hypothetical protein
MNKKYEPRYYKIPEIKFKGHFMVGFDWDITGSTGNSYSVGFNDGGLDCSCPGFGWQRKCKHVKGIAANLIAEDYPKYAHFSG